MTRATWAWWEQYVCCLKSALVKRILEDIHDAPTDTPSWTHKDAMSSRVGDLDLPTIQCNGKRGLVWLIYDFNGVPPKLTCEVWGLINCWILGTIFTPNVSFRLPAPRERFQAGNSNIANLDPLQSHSSFQPSSYPSSTSSLPRNIELLGLAHWLVAHQRPLQRLPQLQLLPLRPQPVRPQRQLLPLLQLLTLQLLQCRNLTTYL